ncbi:MAG: ABC transporter permease [Sporolactobacillus sp.]
MVQLRQLWRQRCADQLRMQLRYWNLIGRNSGLMFFAYAMVVVAAFYYKKWLDNLPPHFPGGVLIAAALTLVAVPSPVRTFMERADLVFLQPAAEELNGYFRKSRWYSFAAQSAVLLVLLLICAPLELRTAPVTRSAYVAFAALVLAAKAWNMDCAWQQLKMTFARALLVPRVLLTLLFFLALFSGAPLPVAGVCLLLMLLASCFVFHRLGRRGLLDWAALIAVEEHEAMKFLRFANLFTDVPRLAHHVRARRWLTGFLSPRGLNAQPVYRSLYSLTFLRSDDYLGQYVRLTVLGALAVYFAGLGLFTVFLAVSFVYLSGLQLLPLFGHPFPQALEGLYPLDEGEKQAAFRTLTHLLLILQSAVLAAAALPHGLPAAALCLAGGLIVSLGFALRASRRFKA